LYDRYDLSGAIYGHLGQGCVHSRISFDLQTAPGIQRFRDFMEEAAYLCVSYGGSLSGEHGDGQARGELLSRMYGEELVEAFRRFKRIWDPQWKMNPGKVVDAKPMDDQLKLSPGHYSPPAIKTHFSFAEDGGNFASNFANTTLRCVGVGKCLAENDTMCPSYMVTREEKHTTRGRARMLFEMMQGEQIDRGWRDPEVHDSLELCLSCKGCKTDCPVGVDMATYKSEFLSHYFKGRLRPAPAYVMGLVFVWARLGSAVPHLANLLTQTPVLSGLAKKLGGLAPQRPAPKLASQTLESWFADRDPVNEGRPLVMVWPDTFNNYFHPEAGKATVEMLESAGYQVEMPGRNLCCGRPLYDYGMLTTAKALLRQTVTTLRPQIVAGTPIVGIEPSCVAVFREEMTKLISNDEDAKRLSSQFFTLGEFLEDHDYQPPRLNGRALLHPHCHQSAVMGISAEERLLGATGLEVTLSKAGCCGLAGSFGFEAGEKYDMSVAVGQRRLIPKVKDASDETLLVADGFSCKSQIEHLTSRRALHLAQVLRMAGNGEDPRLGARPEDGHPDAVQSPQPTRAEWLILGLTGVACMAPWIRRYRRKAFGRPRGA
ncbi:MAG: 4Fe-4S dicluster domain-containing protein, partial [Actinobacteria bacterium]|nr:4Fe-4S dicluster domain-containing protein [Actinomycetota bacterium]